MRPGPLLAAVGEGSRLSPAEEEAAATLQIQVRSLPRRRKSANTTKNMQKINSLVRSGLATSFSLRHLALLWEAFIIFYCFTHSQKYDETRTECVFFLSSYSKRHKLFTHETQPHFLLKRSFLLSSGAWKLRASLGWWWTSGLSHPPQPKHMGISLMALTWCPHSPLDPTVPKVGANFIRWRGWWGRDGAEVGFGAVPSRQWGPPPQHPELSCQILLETHVLGQCQSNQCPLH